MPDKNLIAKLILDNKAFKQNLSESQKDVLKFSAAVTGAGAAVLAAAKMAANYRDETVKLAHAAGVTTDVFSGLAHAAELSNINNEQLAKSLTKLNNITPQAAKELERFGLKVTDSSGKLKSSETIMSEVADRMAAMKSPFDRAALAFKLFGEEGVKMVNMLSGGSEALRDAASEAERFGLVVTEQAGANAEYFNDSFSRAGLAVKGLTVSVSESVIAFINQSGVIDAVTEAIASVTTMWRSLDDDTKNEAVAFGAFAVAGAVVAATVIGIQAALAPLVAALTPVALAVGAIAAAFAILAFNAIKYWSQIKGVIEPASKFFSDALKPIQEAFSTVVENIAKLVPSVTSSGDKISYFGSVTKGVFAVIAAGAIIVGAQFKIVGNIVYNLVDLVLNAAGAITKFFAGDFEGALQSAKLAYDNLHKATVGTVDILIEAKDAVRDIFSQKLTVKIDDKAVEKLKEKLGDVKKRFDGLADKPKYTSSIKEAFKEAADAVAAFRKSSEKNLSGLTPVFITVAKAAGEVVNVIGQFTAQFGKFADLQAASIQRASQKTIANLDMMGRALDKMYDANVESVTNSEDAKIAALEKSYDDQIALIQAREAMRNSIISQAALERTLIADEEYQKLKEQREAEYQAFVESEIAKFEAEKAFILAHTADKEQAQLVETEMDANLKTYLESLQQQHNADMEGLAQEYKDKISGIKTEETDALKASQELSSTDAQALEQQKNDALTKAEEEKNAKLKKLDEENNKRKELMDRIRAQKTYQAELAIYQTTKMARISEAIVGGAAAALAAFSPTLLILGPIGFAIAAGLATAIAATTAMTISQIASTPPPPPPILREGGMIGGNVTHEQGGFRAEVESNEFVIDKTRTRQIEEAIDNGVMGSKGLTLVFNFGENSIVGTQMDSEEAARKMGELIGQQLRRMGFVA